MIRYFITFVLFSAVLCNEPQIVDEILPEVKPVNSIGILNCTVTDTTLENKVFWAKIKVSGSDKYIIISKNEEIVLSNNEDLGRQEDSGKPKYGVIMREDLSHDLGDSSHTERKTYSLVVRYLNEEDDGDYVCFIQLLGEDFHHWPKKLGHLTVQVAPKIKPSEVSVLESEAGGNITLKCEAHGKPEPNITWKREDGDPLPGGRTVFFGKTVTLKRLTKNASGTYLCIADNSVRPPADYKVQVRIFYAPMVKPVMNTVGQVQNRRVNAKLECIVEGYPEPVVIWELLQNKKRKIVNDNTQFSIDRMLSAYGYMYVLTIKNVAAEDYTDYWCMATNKYGTTQTKFTVFETMECQGPSCKSLKAHSSQVTATYFLTIFIPLATASVVFRLLTIDYILCSI